MPTRVAMAPTSPGPRTRASIRSTWAIGVSGRMPWPRLKMNGPPANAASTASTALVERRAAGEQHQRIEIALHRPRRLDLLAREAAIDHPVESDRIDRDPLDIAPQRRAGAARKPDDLRVRHSRSRTPATIRSAGSMHQRSNSSGGSTPAQVSKICTASTPASNCRDQVVDRRLDQHVDQTRRRPADRDRRTAAPAPDPACHGRPPCRSRPSMARRRSRETRRCGGSCRRTSRIVSKTGASTCMVDHRGEAAEIVSPTSGGASCGPSPAAKLTVCPSACGMTRMSENRIAASKPNRRIGCNVTSAASSGVKHRSRKLACLLAHLHGTPADSDPPAASSRPEASLSVRPASTSRSLGLRHDRHGHCHTQ